MGPVELGLLSQDNDDDAGEAVADANGHAARDEPHAGVAAPAAQAAAIRALYDEMGPITPTQKVSSAAVPRTLMHLPL